MCLKMSNNYKGGLDDLRNNYDVEIENLKRFKEKVEDAFTDLEERMNLLEHKLNRLSEVMK